MLRRVFPQVCSGARRCGCEAGSGADLLPSSRRRSSTHIRTQKRIRNWLKSTFVGRVLPRGSARGPGTLFVDVAAMRTDFANPGIVFLSKKCKCAVLSDAPFIKHEKTLWHDVSCRRPSCSYNRLTRNIAVLLLLLILHSK